MATDSSKSEEALIHFAKNNIFDIIVFIQPTSPLLTSIDIDGGLNLISKYNSVFLVPIKSTGSQDGVMKKIHNQLVGKLTIDQCGKKKNITL